MHHAGQNRYAPVSGQHRRENALMRLPRPAVYMWLVCVVVICFLSSCSVTRGVPDDRRLLTKNIIVTDDDTPKRDRIKRDEVEGFIRPMPNKKFLGTRVNIHLHNAGGVDSVNKSFFRRLFRRLGDEPVLLDSLLVEQSAKTLRDYMVFAGYHDSHVEFEIDTSKNKKAKVTYRLHQLQPYRIRSIEYVFKDEFIRPIVLQDTANTLIRSGDVLDLKVLVDERQRIVSYLNNSGYYNFDQRNLRYRGDSTIGNHLVDLTIELNQNIAGYADRTPIYENNSIYRIREVIVNPDFEPMALARDPDYYLSLDTVNFNGLRILRPPGRVNVRSRILREAITIYPNSLYSAAEVNQVYSNIMRLGYYRNTSIVFEEVEQAEDEENLITFIGGDDGFLETTTEKYLICRINCTPALRQSYKIELEGTTTSNYYGLSTTVGYQNRNLFRGVELFDVTAKVGWEFMRQRGLKGAFEIGGATSISLPRFITPFNIDRYHKAVNPRTKVEISINSQRRPSYYNRTLSSASWGYTWNNGKNSSYILRPVDLNLVKLGYLNESFINSLTNQYLRNSYISQLVAGISGSYLFNSQLSVLTPTVENSLLFRFNWETAGNLVNGLSKLFSTNKVEDPTGDYHRIFGIRYAQYFRVDASFSDRIALGSQTSLAYRLYGGIGLSYGNARSLPFDRLFYAGGSNSMRGWVARTLGPGNTPEDDSNYMNQLGNMKLEANLEARFPVWGMLKGAVFFDMGNIWFVNEGTGGDPDGIFKVNRFYKQLGLNTGIGIRFDIRMAILRFDWGLKLHEPNKPAGERWIQKFKIGRTVLNFGVGYPF